MGPIAVTRSGFLFYRKLLVFNKLQFSILHEKTLTKIKCKKVPETLDKN